MHAFYISDGAVMMELERAVRNAGASLVSKGCTWWIAYYYQSVFTGEQHAQNPDLSVPVFSVLGKEGDETTFIVSEVEDPTPVMQTGEDLLIAPVRYTDISEMNYMFFDKVKIFNLKNKRIKKLNVVFMHFILDGTQILLGDNFFLVKSDVVDENILRVLEGAGAGSVRNLEKFSASLRSSSFGMQFYIYWLFKMRDTITIPRPVLTTKEIAYADCVFVKDSLLV
jgi:hypothetical protein